jgi:hypothetical protein
LYGENASVRRKALLDLSPIQLPDREKAAGSPPITVGRRAILKDRRERLRAFNAEEFVEKLHTLK